MTLQELEQIKNLTLKQNCLDQGRRMPRVTVSMGTCGIKAGAGTLLDTLRKEAGPAGALVTHVGCIGLCACEPLVEVAVPGQPLVTYGRMTPEMAATVVREHIVGGRPVAEWVVAVNRTA